MLRLDVNTDDPRDSPDIHTMTTQTPTNDNGLMELFVIKPPTPTRLSCRVHVVGVNRTGDKSRLLATENFETVLSSLEMRCEQSFVLSRPSFQFATMTCLQTRFHRRLQDWTHTVQSNIILTTIKRVYTADRTGLHCSV